MSATYPVEVYGDLTTASDWHGGQWSPLYSLASTGKVWSENHRDLLFAEIDDNLRGCTDDEQIVNLQCLAQDISEACA